MKCVGRPEGITGGGTILLVLFGNPLGALMKFPQLGDLKMCV